MGKVTILDTTTKNPITLIGERAGICWGADTSDHNAKYKRERGPDGRILPDNLTGKRFGRLTALQYVGKGKWLCQCDCGNTRINKAQCLKEGRVVSCGCYKDELLSQRSYKHGSSYNPLYRVWWGMKERCQNENHKAYHRYGGRGITICKEWLDNYKSFEKWALDAGYEKGLTVERIDNDKGYSPDNCRMATRKEQSRNMRRNRGVARISESGETIAEYKTIVEAAEATGCNQVSIGKVCMGKEKSTHGMFWKYLN